MRIQHAVVNGHGYRFVLPEFPEEESSGISLTDERPFRVIHSE